MTESQLLALFQRALRTSLAMTLVACSSSSEGTSGGSTTSSTSGKTPGDGGAGKGSSTNGSSPSSTKGSSTPPGTSSSTAMDAGSSTASSTGATDGGRDRSAPSDACAPSSSGLNQCGGGNGGYWTIPLTCVPGGASGVTEGQCAMICGNSELPISCGVLTLPDGGSSVVSCRCEVNGRAYAGMPLPRTSQTTVLGRYLAMTAQLEAASVDAFQILEGELVHHGAPRPLIEGAKSAATDEIRHARTTRQLARRHGPAPSARRAGARAPRSLEEIALENAVEGCVRETYAALVAHHQGLAAGDVEIRDAMGTIARDETRHAALAWQVAAWAEEGLDHAARRRVAHARARAVEELRGDLAKEPPGPITRDAGVPDARSALRMLAVLEEHLWLARPSVPGQSSPPRKAQDHERAPQELPRRRMDRRQRGGHASGRSDHG